MLTRREIQISACAAAMIAMVGVHGALADFDISYMGAARLSEICESQVPISVTSCSAYIIGALDAIRQVGSEAECSFKLDPNMSRQQAVDDVKWYLEANPEAAKLTAVMVIKAALQHFYPCDQ